MEKITVAIVEDDEEIRKWLQETVETAEDLDLQAVFSNVSSFIKDFDTIQPDVVLMDIRLPDMTGIEAVKQLKPKRPEIQYLMCTVFEDADHIFDSLCAGATGYLVKNTTQQRLCEAIREIAAGGSPMSSQIARKVVSSFGSPRKASEAAAVLSVRESEILEYLAQGYRYKEIAGKLHISTETVRTHIRNIYEKLHVQSRTEALNKVYPRS